ncbi:4a-hydroxytetrahydrobiopterin dehydratase [Donghicola sp. C2-DW-16]|uniref:Putative pterin-4-alpha-carbinolamine dehydratase n=1 Tax=Donghicola mangrovi TaxID=2729614 RepID=A0ABX2PAT6_9RHOB|nr:4a-hydroxytetrahydrobiopterin dehydratase [Donghicola mangrovi]NVO26061.1 4a-hydroxytetrahydrobiopterin dehydratase [Donghicola mangrovi]
MTDLLTAEELDTAMAELAPLGWTVVEDGIALSRQFKFADFPTALGWMVRMGVHAEKLNHHPDWTNVYNRVDVRLSTHDAGGLTALDVKLARKMSA